MQNEPKLSAEIEKRYYEVFGNSQLYMLPCGVNKVFGHSANGYLYSGMEINPDDIKHFIATALEEQRAELIGQLEKIDAEKWKDEEHCTCLEYAIAKLKGEAE